MSNPVFFPHDEVFVLAMAVIVLVTAAVVIPVSSWYYDRKYKKPKSRY